MAKIIGHGAPTSKTFGVLGQEYFDKDSNKVYTCTKVTHKTAYRAGEADAEYEWSIIGGGSDLFEVKKPRETILAHTVIADVDYVNGGALEADKEYTVVLDGIEYKVVAIKNNNMVGVVVPFDNEAFIYASVVYSTGGGYGWIEAGADLAETVAIYAEGEEFVTTKTEKKAITILPEQTSFSGSANYVRYIDYNCVIEEGKEYIVVVNGEAHKVIFDKSSGGMITYFDLKNGIRISLGFNAFLSSSGNNTITCVYEDEWRFDLLESLAIYEETVSNMPLDPAIISGAEPDLVIEIKADGDAYFEELSNDNFTLVKGTVDTVLAKIEEGKEPIIHIVNEVMYGDNKTCRFFKPVFVETMRNQITNTRSIYFSFLHFGTMHDISMNSNNVPNYDGKTAIGS